MSQVHEEVVDPEIEPLWRVEHVARYLDVSEAQVRVWCHDGKLKYIDLGRKMWRFSPRAVEEFVDAHTVRS